MNLNATVTAAVIAGIVSLIGVAISIVTARIQATSKVEELTQTQLKELLLKRIEVYPSLWKIPQTLLSDWERLRKPVNADWAQELFKGLVEWHKENGVFLGQKSYEAFGALRDKAQEVVRKCDNQSYQPTLADLQAMDLIYYKGFSMRDGSWHLGLATCLKNDLGSYKVTVVTVSP